MAPAASLVRFVLLIAAVVATSGLAFVSIYVQLPGTAQRLIETTDACVAARDADPRVEAALATGDTALRDEASRRLQACMNPVALDWGRFVGVGLLLLFAVATVAYLLHPWWIVRRRRLRRLTADRQSGLVGELDRLSGRIGLARPPDWRLAPHARTTGGQAFGLPWHRYVQIDAGLAVLRVTRPDEFRAVVLHELAHLRNRDVDKTYFTIGTWRAFVAVALVPYLALMLHPNLLRAPRDWRWEDVVADPAQAAYRLGSLAVLAAVVYLTRNAILRVRETHADATAAAVGGAGPALSAVLARLPSPPAWRRWGTHPHPRQRLDAVGDPGLLYAVSPWELVGVGLATGLVCDNLAVLAGSLYLVDSALAVSAVGLVTGALAAVLLAVAVWRATAGDPSATPAWRTWLLYPLAVVGGYVAGTFLTLREATAGQSPSAPGPVSRLVALSLLAVGAVFLAAWVASAGRGVLAGPDRPRWAMPAVVGVTGFVGAVWFAVWLPHSAIDNGFARGWGSLPAVGADIGWYAWVARVSGVESGSLLKLVFNPLTLSGLTLMWLVPVLAGLRSSERIRVRPALLAALAGAAGLAAAVVALPYAVRRALPESVRATADVDGVPFLTVYDNAVLAVASVAVAVVMTVTVARRGPHRPVLALLAGTAMTVLATLVVTYIADPAACFANVGAAVPGGEGCLHGVPARRLGTRAHFIIVQAIIVAVPAMLVVAAVRLLGPPGPDTGAATHSGTGAAVHADTGAVVRVPGRLGVVAAGATLTVLVAVLVWLSVLVAPTAYRLWLELAFG